ncbi:hypothetical protein D3C73_1355530 [compost metagenome]
MERAGLKTCGIALADTRQQGDAFAHFCRCFAGECEQQQLRRRDASHRQQIPGPADQHRCFAGAGPGQGQERSEVMSHRCDLRRVKQNAAFLQPAEIGGIAVLRLNRFAAGPG